MSFCSSWSIPARPALAPAGAAAQQSRTPAGHCRFPTGGRRVGDRRRAGVCGLPLSRPRAAARRRVCAVQQSIGFEDSVATKMVAFPPKGVCNQCARCVRGLPRGDRRPGSGKDRQPAGGVAADGGFGDREGAARAQGSAAPAPSVIHNRRAALPPPAGARCGKDASPDQRQRHRSTSAVSK